MIKHSVHMKKRQVKMPILLQGGKWKTVCLLLLLGSVTATTLRAQTDGNSALQVPKDMNSELRTKTWSIYTQGGLSWATGVWYQNVNENASYHLAPAVGGGLDYTIRPWIRVGAEYLWSSCRREQNFSSIDVSAMPAKAYGNYMMNYHNAKLGVQFNVLEFWPQRQQQWLNIWAGTGFGYGFFSGNEYGIFFSNTQTQNGVTTPLTDGSAVLNDSEITITGSVRTTNRHEGVNAPFVPASLHIEADLNRRFTIGLKGEANWLFNRQNIAPQCLVFAMATLRYNFVPSSTRVQRAYYEGVVNNLYSQEKNLKEQLKAAKAKAEREEANRQKLQEQNDLLLQQLSEREEREENGAANEGVTHSHFVQFDHNSSYFSSSERDRLKEFARSVMGKKLSLLAEASTPGTDEYNQQISERRLERVVQALIDEGFPKENLNPQIAIGEQNGKPSAEGRRVTITVE